MIQWLAHKDFTCFIPEWINVFWTNVFFKSPAGDTMYLQSLFEALSHFQKGFLYFDRYCTLCPN